MSHVFDEYAPVKADITERRNGVLVSQDDGVAVAYALWKLQERGRMFVSPGNPGVRGHDRRHPQPRQRPRRESHQDQAAHQHPRLRKDEAIDLVTPIQLTLEYAVEFIGDDELVEITPKSIRLRKRFLKENERRRAERDAA